MERLPDEVQAKIRDMACVVRSNGVTSSDLELVVRTDALPSSCIKEVEAWILRCLQHSRFDYVVGAGESTSGCTFPHHIIYINRL